MTNLTDTAANIGKHVFESAGLGAAPFRLMGCEEKHFQAHPDAPKQAGGSCDYCGHAIVLFCHIKSADGRRFKVGSDCVAKAGDAGLMRAYKTSPSRRKLNKAKAIAKDQSIKDQWAALVSDAANLAKMDAAGLVWVWARCGAAGRARYLKAAQKLLAEVTA